VLPTSHASCTVRLIMQGPEQRGVLRRSTRIGLLCWVSFNCVYDRVSEMLLHFELWAKFVFICSVFGL
jgi:hypothetical protein